MSVGQVLNLTGGVILTTVLHAFCAYLLATCITDGMHLSASIRNIMADDPTCSFTSLEVQRVSMILYVKIVVLFFIQQSVDYMKNKGSALSREYYELALNDAQKEAQYYKEEMERVLFGSRPAAEHDNDASDGEVTAGHNKD